MKLRLLYSHVLLQNVILRVCPSPKDTGNGHTNKTWKPELPTLKKKKYSIIIFLKYFLIKKNPSKILFFEVFFVVGALSTMLNVLQSTKKNLYAELQTHTLTEKKPEVKTPSRSIRTFCPATRGLYTRIQPKTLDLVIIVYATLASRPIYYTQQIEAFQISQNITIIKL